MLNHGNTSFANIAGVDAKGNPDTPLIFGPVTPGTTTLDTESNDGKVVVLKLDSSVNNYSINSSGKIMYHGMDLLDPKNPIWGGKAPDVKWAK